MTNQGEDHDAAIDALYALPLDEFTGGRDELARRLRRAGDRDAAAEVKRLRKPSVPAWALNRARRNNRAQSDELLDAGRRLREAQERLLAGGDREPLEQAAADERRLVAELARHAERELTGAGRPVSGQVQERLRATLHAVAGDEEARAGLESGRLVGDHRASGLGPLVALPRGGAQRRPEPQAASTTDARGDERARDAAAGAQERKALLEEQLERARARRHELDAQGAAAGERLREARREAERAAVELERAEAAEGRVRRQAEEAAEAAAELERELREP